MKSINTILKYTAHVAYFVLFSGFLINYDHARAQTPYWSTTIAAIMYDHCTNCHHEGAIAPFSLMTYDEAVLWAPSILAQINAGIMPPWPPDPDYNHFMNENVLSEEEINAINLWVDNDMPSGDLNQAPPPPVYNGSSLMQNPDETILLPVFSMPTAENVYWRFVNQSGYTEDKYINSMEFVAGNPGLIHHVTVGLDQTGMAWEDDQNYPGPGCPRDFGVNPGVSVFMAQSEGRVVKLPANIGFEVPAGSDYVSDIHYFPEFIGEVDSSKINLKFCDVNNARHVKTEKSLYGKEPSLLDGPLEIPANTVKTFHLMSNVYTQDKSLLGLGPHSHQICKSWEVFMVYPTGDTIPLIKIPDWDFDWQGSYLLTKVIKIPAGSQIFGTVTYDNTVNNPDNPSNPPQDVYGNGSMLGEMAQVHCWLMDYEPGDEDIILDSSFYGYPTSTVAIHPENLLKVYPNPASEMITLEYAGAQAQTMITTICNNLGKIVYCSTEQFTISKFLKQIDCASFAAGIYFVSVQAGDRIGQAKVVIVK